MTEDQNLPPTPLPLLLQYPTSFPYSSIFSANNSGGSRVTVGGGGGDDDKDKYKSSGFLRFLLEAEMSLSSFLLPRPPPSLLPRSRLEVSRGTTSVMKTKGGPIPPSLPLLNLVRGGSQTIASILSLSLLSSFLYD